VTRPDASAQLRHLPLVIKPGPARSGYFLAHVGGPTLRAVTNQGCKDEDYMSVIRFPTLESAQRAAAAALEMTREIAA
jgi:hypothetical protein